jgi:hypothetical protein
MAGPTLKPDEWLNLWAQLEACWIRRRCWVTATSTRSAAPKRGERVRIPVPDLARDVHVDHPNGDRPDRKTNRAIAGHVRTLMNSHTHGMSSP